MGESTTFTSYSHQKSWRRWKGWSNSPPTSITDHLPGPGGRKELQILPVKPQVVYITLRHQRGKLENLWCWFLSRAQVYHLTRWVSSLKFNLGCQKSPNDQRLNVIVNSRHYMRLGSRTPKEILQIGDPGPFKKDCFV